MKEKTIDVSEVDTTEDSKHTITYLSAPVGSGKTQAIVEEIKSHPHKNYLYVTPTRDLAREIKARLDEAIEEEFRKNVHLIVDENEPYVPTVIRRTITAVQDRNEDQSHTLIITTENFKALLMRMHEHQKRHYDVFIDEGMDAVDEVQFNTPQVGMFMELIEVGDNGEFFAKGTNNQLLEYVANNPKRLASIGREELSGPGFRRLSYLITSDIYDVYGTVSERTIRAVAFLSPREFLPFNSVTMIMANFERSLIALFWQKKYGIQFEAFDTSAELFDTHTAKGSKMIIYYALSPGDWPSKMNLERNWKTGSSTESPDSGERVIDRISEVLGEKFSGQQYCWSANQHFTNEKGALNNHRMPIKCAGLNQFKDFDIVFCLACMNPRPWVKSLITKHVKLGDTELYERWRFESTYQTIGRCSLRDRQSDREIVVVVISKRCAEQLASIFPGSEVAGQLTDLPNYTAMRKRRGPAKATSPYLKSDNTAWWRYKESSHYQGETKEQWYYETRLKHRETSNSVTAR